MKRNIANCPLGWGWIDRRFAALMAALSDRAIGLYLLLALRVTREAIYRETYSRLDYVLGYSSTPYLRELANARLIRIITADPLMVELLDIPCASPAHVPVQMMPVDIPDEPEPIGDSLVAVQACLAACSNATYEPIPGSSKEFQ